MNDRVARARTLDSVALRSLRFQLEAATDALADDLAAINDYLAKGAPLMLKPEIASAFNDAPDKMNEIRELLGEIEPITRDAERAEPQRHK